MPQLKFTVASDRRFGVQVGQAFTDGKKIYIRFANDFSLSMVNNDATKTKVRAAICMVRGTEVLPEDLIFGVLEGTEDKITDLDDLQV